MGKEARTALLLAASGCLLAVMVEWIIGELQSDSRRCVRPSTIRLGAQLGSQHRG